MSVTHFGGDLTGVLHAQYAWYLPLSYIYFSAGRRGVGMGAGRGARASSRLLLVTCAHAALVAPSACVLLAGAARSDVHYALVQGLVSFTCRRTYII